MKQVPIDGAQELLKKISMLSEFSNIEKDILQRLIACSGMVSGWLPEARNLKVGELASKLSIIHIQSKNNFLTQCLASLKSSAFGHLYLRHLKHYSFVRRLSFLLWRILIPFFLKSKSFFCEISAFNSSKPILRLNEYVNSHGISAVEVADTIRVKVPKCSVIPNRDVTIFESNERIYDFQKITIAELGRGKIYGGSNLIFMSNTVICHDLYDFTSDYTSEELHGRHYINNKKMRINIFQASSKSSKIPIAASFVDACAVNYAHWISEVLPRIAVFCSSEYYLNVPIIVNSDLHPNIMDSLALIAGSNRQVILLPIGMALEVTSLLETSAVGYVPFEIRKGYSGRRHHGIFNPYGLNLLRKKALLAASNLTCKEWPERFYIRRNSGVRRVKNFLELEEDLLLHGFICVEPENLTFLEQVALFANAKDIVSPTGAGLVNAIFCKPETRICILMSRHKNMIYGYWQSMFATFNLKITHLLGNTVDDERMDLHSDFFVDSGDLKKYLDSIN